MFSKDKKSASIDRPLTGSATLISAGTVLQGDIECEGDLRIDGIIQGSVQATARVIIGPDGQVEGNIRGAQADVGGTVNGHITVSDLLQLRGGCSVKGNLTARHLQVDPAAVFNGQCTMTGPAAVAVPGPGTPASVYKMNEGDAHAKAR